MDMVSGRTVVESDRELLLVRDGGDLCSVEEFPYLGSIIAASGRMDFDVERCITKASQAFGAEDCFQRQELNFKH